jgi:hypothetical protein
MAEGAQVAGDQVGGLAGGERLGGGRQAANDIAASVLEPLSSDSFRTLRDRGRPGSDATSPAIDQVVVAVGGAFVIDVESWPGRVDLADGVLRSAGELRSAEVARVLADAIAVSELLDSWTGPQWSIPVWPVLCLVGEAQVGGWAAIDDVHVVDVAWLGDFIQSLEPQLGPAHVAWAHDALGSHLPVRPVAADPPPAEAPAEAPPEPIVYLTRWSDGTEDRFYVSDEDGTPGGYLDLRTGETHGASPVATSVLQQVLPHLLADGAATSGFDAAARGGVGRFLDALRGRRGSDEIPVVACLEWGEGGRRLYAFRFEPGGAKTDLGWIDLTDRRTAAVVAGADPILRYCGDRYRTRSA